MKTIDALRPTLSKFAAAYARGRSTHPVLAPYASPDEALRGLGLSSPLDAAARDAITLALVAEHQRTQGSLWQSLLLVAYEPMLARIRGRLFDKRDAEARLVLAFLEAVAKVSLAHPPSCLALDLRRAVERSVFGTGAAADDEGVAVSLEHARNERSAEDLDGGVALEEQKRILFAELEEVFGGDAAEILAVLVRARTGREQLLELVEELHPEATSKQRAAAYERLQRLRRRALAHLEERFGREGASSSSAA